MMKPENKFALYFTLGSLAVALALSGIMWLIVEYAAPLILIILVPIAFVTWLAQGLGNGGKVK